MTGNAYFPASRMPPQGGIWFDKYPPIFAEPSKGTKQSLRRTESSNTVSSGHTHGSKESTANSTASSRNSSRGSSRDTSRGSSAERAARAAGAAAVAVAGQLCKKRGLSRRPRSPTRSGRGDRVPASSMVIDTTSSEEEPEVPPEFTHLDSPAERLRRGGSGVSQGKLRAITKMFSMQTGVGLPEEVWCNVLVFLDVPDVCRLSDTCRMANTVALGYSGADFNQPGWLRERRKAVKARWSRARSVLTQLKVIRGFVAATPAQARGRRCVRVQRLNGHRR